MTMSFSKLFGQFCPRGWYLKANAAITGKYGEMNKFE